MQCFVSHYSRLIGNLETSRKRGLWELTDCTSGERIRFDVSLLNKAASLSEDTVFPFERIRDRLYGASELDPREDIVQEK